MFGELDEKKRQLTAEIDDLNRRIAEKNSKRSSGVYIEDFEGSTDPEVIDLLKEIRETEENISTERIETLRAEVAKLQERASAYSAGTEKLKGQIGDVPEEHNEEIESLQKQIEEMKAKVDEANIRISKMLMVSQSMDRMRGPASFLEHLRTSDTFLSSINGTKHQ